MGHIVYQNRLNLELYKSETKEDVCEKSQNLKNTTGKVANETQKRKDDIEKEKI